MVQHGTREKLVEAARDLFLTQGYNATGVAQILKQAGANSGSLYYFFPTKEDLLIAVLEWYRDNIDEALLKPIFERIDDPIERVFGVLDCYRQLILALDYSYGCPIGNLALEISNSHPRARGLIAANFDNWRKAVADCIRAAAGRLPEDVDPEGLATHVLTVMEGGVMLSRAYRTIAPFDAAVNQLRDYFERLIRDGSDWSHPRQQAAD